MWEYFSLQFSPISEGELFCLRVSRLRLLFFLIRRVLGWRRVWSLGVMRLTGESRTTRKTLSQCHVDWPEIAQACPLWEAWAMDSPWRLKLMHIIYTHILWVCCGLDDPGFESREGQKMFFSCLTCQDGAGATDFLLKSYRGSVPGAKAVGAWGWPPLRAEVKDEWNYTCTPPICHHGVASNSTTFSFLKNKVSFRTSQRKFRVHCKDHSVSVVFCSLLFVMGILWNINPECN
jgi:hypothetical protein